MDTGEPRSVGRRSLHVVQPDRARYKELTTTVIHDLNDTVSSSPSPPDQRSVFEGLGSVFCSAV